MPATGTPAADSMLLTFASKKHFAAVVSLMDRVLNIKMAERSSAAAASALSASVPSLTSFAADMSAMPPHLAALLPFDAHHTASQRPRPAEWNGSRRLKNRQSQAPPPRHGRRHSRRSHRQPRGLQQPTSQRR